MEPTSIQLPKRQPITKVKRPRNLKEYLIWILLLIYFAFPVSNIYRLHHALHHDDLEEEIKTKMIPNSPDIQMNSTKDTTQRFADKTTTTKTTTTVNDIIEEEDKITLESLDEKCQDFEIIYQSIDDVKNIKPIWFAFYPGTWLVNNYKDFIQQLTGLNNAGKSFYARTTTMKRCIDPNSATITCQTVHPTVPMNEKLINHPNYESSIRIIALRNPMTAIPYHINEKGHLYHNLPPGEQVSMEEWRSVRDEHFTTMLQNWINTITTWGDSTNDKTSQATKIVYIPHEYLSSPIHGTKVFAKLLKEFKTLNIPVTKEVEDASCLWHNFNKQNPVSVDYEYTTYQPGYTINQKNAMLEALQTLLKDQSTLLKTILQQYHDIILNNCPIDDNDNIL